MNTTSNYCFLIASSWTTSGFIEAHLVVKFGEILNNESLLIFMQLLILCFSVFCVSLSPLSIASARAQDCSVSIHVFDCPG